MTCAKPDQLFAAEFFSSPSARSLSPPATAATTPHASAPPHPSSPSPTARRTSTSHASAATSSSSTSGPPGARPAWWRCPASWLSSAASRRSPCSPSARTKTPPLIAPFCSTTTPLRHRQAPRNLHHRLARHPPPQVRLRPGLDQPRDHRLPQQTLRIISCRQREQNNCHSERSSLESRHSGEASLRVVILSEAQNPCSCLSDQQYAFGDRRYTTKYFACG